VHQQDGQIIRVTSPLDHTVTHGNLCIKGRFGWQFVQIREKGLDAAVTSPAPPPQEKK
jgi:predicted molibdopterin-dependent oxidoreductase YjgC